MQQLEIVDFNLLVHPDFESTIYTGSRREAKLRPEWDKNVAQIAKKGNSLLIYYSAFPHNPGLSDKNQDKYPTDAIERELGRRERYVGQLGERFFFFGLMEMPNAIELQLSLSQRDLTYDPRHSTLTAYGEYYEACVELWMRSTQKALGLADKRCRKNPALSLQRNNPTRITNNHPFLSTARRFFPGLL